MICDIRFSLKHEGEGRAWRFLCIPLKLFSRFNRDARGGSTFPRRAASMAVFASPSFWIAMLLSARTACRTVFPVRRVHRRKRPARLRFESQQSEKLLTDIERACAGGLRPEPGAGRAGNLDGRDAGDEAGNIDEQRACLPGRRFLRLSSQVRKSLSAARPRAGSIFDGLQRATTLAVLLCVIGDLSPHRMACAAGSPPSSCAWPPWPA